MYLLAVVVAAVLLLTTTVLALLAHNDGRQGRVRGREGNLLAFLEQAWPVLRNGERENAGVTIILDVEKEALDLGVRAAGDLLATATRELLTVEGVDELLGLLRVDKVDESVTDVDAIGKIDREVEEIVAALESALIELVQDHALRELVRDVTKHDGGAVVLEHLVGGAITHGGLFGGDLALASLFLFKDVHGERRELGLVLRVREVHVRVATSTSTDGGVHVGEILDVGSRVRGLLLMVHQLRRRVRFLFFFFF